MNWFRLFIIIILLSRSFSAFGQVNEKTNATKPVHPVFADGIYLNFNQVKEGNPVPKSRIVSSKEVEDKDFFKDVLSGKSLRFYDAVGSLNNIPKKSIWGYSSGGMLYIQYEGIFNPVDFPGRISHFLADVTNADSTNYLTANPFYYSRKYSNYMLRAYPRSYDMYDKYTNRNYQPFTNGREPFADPDKKIFLQLLLDFDSGNILEYTVENLKMLLQKDPELYNEYKKLSPGRKRKMMFFYINKFNERNPLELPRPALK